MKRSKRVWVILPLALAALTVTAAASGAVPVALPDTLRILAAKLLGRPELCARVSDTAQTLVMAVRMPRIMAALAVGGALALSGAMFQGVLGNPLADSYTLGVSAGGALGACLCLFLGFTGFGTFSIPAFSLAGALGALIVVLLLSRVGGGFDTVTLVLAGVMVSATLQAGVGFVKFMAGDNVAGLVFWLLGGLSGRTWGEAALVWTGLAAGLCVALFLAKDLDALSLGDEHALALGVSVTRVRLTLLCAAAAMTAVSVAVSGIIGFVGLVVPHMARLLVGPGHRKLVALSVLGGMFLLLAADTASRTLLAHEPPVGVLTAMLGGPYFCLLFLRGRARG